ncbi:MAG: hypothetical protein K2W95_32480 [Candidatus Obscuribacterales bacterium]|nr:hypothetical protein [Candidatus Obscuribacterales bacterium]
MKVFSDAGLARSSLYRSSYSGGWHLYLFFDEPINSNDLRRQLIKLLTLNDFEIAKGTLEVFPNRGNKSLGLGLRLPLQPGFAWLDRRTLEMDIERMEVSATKALELFLDAVDADANSYRDFQRLKSYNDDLELRRSQLAQVPDAPHNIVPLRRSPDKSQPAEFTEFVTSVFRRLPPNLIVDNWYKGRIFHLNGLSGPSQRAEAIVCVSHYLFYGDPSRGLPSLGYGYEQEREWALRDFLSAHHNGQSKDINDDRPDALAQVERAAHWRPAHAKGKEPAKYSPSRPISWIRENENRQKDARQRIQEALDTLRSQQRYFTTVELHELASCSRRTLYDHQDIWRAVYDDRKNYKDVSDGFFEICTDEYNVAVGADSPKIEPPSASLPKITPPGLRAARQIASEIAMRNARAIQRTRKTADSLQIKQEQDWQQKVAFYTFTKPFDLGIENLKLFLVVLLRYLALAPTLEDQLALQSYITDLRQELERRCSGPGLDYG